MSNCTMQHPSKSIQRRAATILEVLFATVVIVVGLLGIATLIPFAARDAQQANNHNQAISLGLGWADSFFARGLHNANANPSEEEFKWIWFRDYTTASGVTPNWEIFSRSGYLGPAAARVNGMATAVESPSFSTSSGGNPSRRIWGHQPVCIDPFFLTSLATAQRINSEIVNSDGSTRPAWYRASVFPYFNDNYDPAVDPFTSVGSSTPLPIDQPRMLRVGLGFYPTTAPYSTSLPLSNQMIADLFGSNDDVVESTYVDLDSATDPRASRSDIDSLAPERLFAQGTSGPMKQLVSKRYSWMATVVPEEPLPVDLALPTFLATPTRSALVSFLILHKHSSDFVPFGMTPVPGSADDKPTGERVVRVYPLSGNFTGGAGGRVRLIGSGSSNSTVDVGDWIMLGRYYIQDTSGIPRLYPYFRWFRIIGVDSSASEDQLQNLRPTLAGDQFGAVNETELCWSRDVILDGPDFAFGEYGALPSVTSPTTGTLVSGVVTVIERQVQLD